MKRIIFTLFFFFMYAAASAQSTVCTRDSFFPNAGNCGYDVSDYRLDMTWDADGDLWDVMEDITFTSEWDTDELHFDFTDSYEIYGMTIDGTAVYFDLKDQDLTIHYNFAHDTEYHLYAGFRGKLNYGYLFDMTGQSRDPGDGFCMLNEPTNAWRYYICNDHPKDRATYHYSFTVPADFTPAGVGRLLEMKEADGTVVTPAAEFTRKANPEGTEGTVTFTYEAVEPMTPYLFAVCAFPFDMRQKTLESGVVQLDFVDNTIYEDLYNEAWKNADQQDEIVQLFESYLGKYPYQDLGAIVSPTFLGAALETQTRPEYDLTTLDGYVFAHELFHQWMGDLITLEDWSDVWIKEGAAMYGECLYKLHFDGQEAYESDLLHNYELIANGPSRAADADNEDVMDMFRIAMEDKEQTEFDRQSAMDAGAAFCRVSEDGTGRIDPDDFVLADGETVTIEQWIDGLKASCKTIRIDHRSFEKFYEMTGVDLNMGRYVDHFAGPKEIDSSEEKMYGHSPYAGGSLVYYALNYKLGDEGFKTAMQTLLDRYQYSTVNEKQFIEVFSEIAGEDLTDYIQSWLYYGEDHIPDLPGLMTFEEARAK